MTKARALAFLFAALLYLLLPTDLVPDFLPLVGWLDDLFLLLAGLWVFWKGFREPKVRPASVSTASSGDPHEVLGLKKGASPEQIKTAYREQMAQYHPDKVAHLGPELRRLAHEKTIAIHRAYQALTGEPG